MTETVNVDAWEASERALVEQRPYQLSAHVANALRGYLERHDDAYEGDRLRVGPDLKPEGEGCDRATWYRLTGAEQDKPTLAKLIRFLRGRKAERLLAKSLKHAGYEVRTETASRPLRPSSWAWGDGHEDVIDVAARHVYEVKAPGLDAWRRAGNDPRRLVRESYRFQFSRYFWEAKRLDRADTGSWIIFDWEGAFEPVEIPLEGDLLVPLDQIVAIEESKARLLSLTEAPPRPASTVEITKVLKGGRATKKNPRPERKVTAIEKRFWGCSHCNYVGVCQPGPAETPVELAADDPRRVAAVRDAEAAWAREDADKKTAKNGASDERREETQPTAPSASETAVPGVLPPVAEPRADVPAQAAVVAGLGAAILTREAVASVALDKGPYQTVVSIEGVVEAEPFRNEDGRLCPLCDGLYGHAHPQSRCVLCGAVGLAENMSGPTAMHVCTPPAHSPENNGAGALPTPAADAPLSTPIADPVPSSSDPSAALPLPSNGAAPPAAPEATPPPANSPTDPPPAAACSSPSEPPEAWEDDEPEAVTAAQDDYLKNPEW